MTMFRELQAEMRTALERRLAEMGSQRPTVHNGSTRQGPQPSKRSGAAEWLVTWEEIAWHLGVSEDTAQRYARREDDPLPVQRLGGRVTIRCSVADEWRESQPPYWAGKGRRERGE
jgi:hypothetical protein